MSERSSDRVIAADSAVDVQRWTIGGFDSSSAPRKPEHKRVVADHLPTVDEVSAIEGQARDDGYRAGFTEAREGGERIASLLANVSESVARMEREMAQTLLTLAVDLARQIIRESLSVRPELIIPIVTEALTGIARTGDPGGIHVHPADLPILEERIGDMLAHAGWKPFPDEHVERGGCRVEFSGGQVDATIAVRWNRLMSQLERSDAWLE